MIRTMNRITPHRTGLSPLFALVLAAGLAALAAGCVPAEPTPRARARSAPRDIAPSRVTLMLLESRDSDFDLTPDTFVVDVVLFAEFESALPVRPAGELEFTLLGAEGDASAETLATWRIDHETLQRVQRKTALGLDGYRVSLSLAAAGVEDDFPSQAGRLRARFIPAAGAPIATGETSVRLGLAQ